MGTKFTVGLADDELRESLIRKIQEIDEEKRDIKLQIHSASTTAKKNRTSIDQIWLQSEKEKICYLSEEREDARIKLGKVNARIKEERRRRNGKPVESISKEFMLIAEDYLNSQDYIKIYDRAAYNVSNKTL